MSKKDRCMFYSPQRFDHLRNDEFFVQIMGCHIWCDVERQWLQKTHGKDEQAQSEKSWALTCYHDATQIELDGNTLDVPAQSLLILPAGSAQRVTGPSFMHSWCKIQGSLADKIFQNDKRLGKLTPTGDPSLFSNGWQKIYHELITHREQSPTVLSLYTQLLLAEVERSQIDPDNMSIPQHVTAAQQFLSEQVSNKVQIKDVAEIAKCSSRHLSREFQRYFGIGPIAYHNSLRLEHARL
ncbi:MAG: helix-turn-helix transcriptional regulator, partial [Planctomycetes bacterium]|nr:helix-turn-helix transcriptional regulator [Planctomycetota bacterium]